MKSRICGILTVGIILAASAVVFAQGGSSTQKTAPGPKPAGAIGPYDKALLTPSTLTAKAPAEFDVKFTTTVGDFVVHVTRSWAPNASDRFYNLVKHHYYDGAAFYRVMSGFMAQWGMSAYPEVTRVWDSATIKDDPITHSSTRGMISYASPGTPNSRTTQLFISYRDNSYLNTQGPFGAFGEVTSGMDVVEKIYSGYGEKPDQGQYSAVGKAYLEKNYPNSTVIKTTTLTVPAPAAATPKP